LVPLKFLNVFFFLNKVGQQLGHERKKSLSSLAGKKKRKEKKRRKLLHFSTTMSKKTALAFKAFFVIRYALS